VKGRERVDDNDRRTDRRLAIRRVEHPGRQHTDRVVWQAAKEVLTMAIALAATYG
jgi:hypothetical protein